MKNRTKLFAVLNSNFWMSEKVDDALSDVCSEQTFLLMIWWCKIGKVRSSKILKFLKCYVKYESSKFLYLGGKNTNLTWKIKIKLSHKNFKESHYFVCSGVFLELSINTTINIYPISKLPFSLDFISLPEFTQLTNLTLTLEDSINLSTDLRNQTSFNFAE